MAKDKKKTTKKSNLLGKIEHIAYQEDLTYLEALSKYMTDHGLTPKQISKSMCSTLKDLIKSEAVEKNLIKNPEEKE